MSQSLDALYQDIILDHARHPRHAGLREPFDAEVHHVNPTCGDEVTLRSHTVDSVVADISYDALGCSISQAAASVLAESLVGLPVDEAARVHAAFLQLMHSQGRGIPEEETLGDAAAFAGVAKFPARVKCALLPWMAWQDAMARSGISLADVLSAATHDDDVDRERPETEENSDG